MRSNYADVASTLAPPADRRPRGEQHRRRLVLRRQRSGHRRPRGPGRPPDGWIDDTVQGIAFDPSIVTTANQLAYR
jgi:hypothetical protein